MTLVERLTGMTVDWDGTQMSDAEEPRAIPSCGDLRAAADEITRLTNELEQIKATYENLEASEILNGYRTRADRLTVENEKLTAYHAFARQNFHTMQNAANELRIRAERAEAGNERLREALLAVVSADDYLKGTGYSEPMTTALDLARAALEQP